jgi:hypothetical protein
MIQTKHLNWQYPDCRSACRALSPPQQPSSFAKRRTALDTQTQLFKSYYNLCQKRSLLKGKTPAQAAGLTDHRWTLRDLLTFNAAITSKIT